MALLLHAGMRMGGIGGWYVREGDPMYLVFFT